MTEKENSSVDDSIEQIKQSFTEAVYMIQPPFDLDARIVEMMESWFVRNPNDAADDIKALIETVLQAVKPARDINLITHLNDHGVNLEITVEIFNEGRTYAIDELEANITNLLGDQS